jgi:hypothetical protein
METKTLSKRALRGEFRFVSFRENTQLLFNNLNQIFSSSGSDSASDCVGAEIFPLLIFSNIKFSKTRICSRICPFEGKRGRKLGHSRSNSPFITLAAPISPAKQPNFPSSTYFCVKEKNKFLVGPFPTYIICYSRNSLWLLDFALFWPSLNIFCTRY